MGQQLVNGQLPAQGTFNGLRVNLADGGFSPSASAYTTGAYMITLLPAQPPIGEVWDLIGWSLSFQGGILTSAPGVFPMYGRLGRLLAGIGRGIQPTSTAGLGPINLPPDLSGLDTIWDGSQDTPFQVFPDNISSAAQLPVGTPIIKTLSLPVPVTVEPGEQIGLGLWLEPSLVQNAQIFIASANYSVMFDDGQGPPATTWGSG